MNGWVTEWINDFLPEEIARSNCGDTEMHLSSKSAVEESIVI